MKVIFIGATAGCGLYALLNMVEAIEKGERHSAFVMARRPGEFKEILLKDHKVPAKLVDTKIHLVRGDALNLDDVQDLFHIAKTTDANSTVQAIVSTIGGKVQMHSNPLKHPSLTPAHCCRDATKVLLKAIDAEFPATYGSAAQPRVIVTTANGTGPTAQNTLPFMLKGMYSFALREVMEDKQDVERLFLRAANLPHPDFNPEPSAARPDDMPSIHRLTILRPAVLTSAPSSTKLVRTGPVLKNAYSVSRSDVGRTLWVECLKGGKWVKQGVSLAY